MFSILVITEENGAATELRSRLAESGFACDMAHDGDEAVSSLSGKPLT